jgi:hypothetical protein
MKPKRHERIAYQYRYLPVPLDPEVSDFKENIDHAFSTWKVVIFLPLSRVVYLYSVPYSEQ